MPRFADVLTIGQLLKLVAELSLFAHACASKSEPMSHLSRYSSERELVTVCSGISGECVALVLRFSFQDGAIQDGQTCQHDYVSLSVLGNLA
jgi:hypothetical protein